MSRDPKRVRKLATAQEALLKASSHLHDIDLRACSKGQREQVKLARELVATASTAVDKAIQSDVVEPA